MKRRHIMLLGAVALVLVWAQAATAGLLPGLYTADVTVVAGSGASAAQQTWSIPTGILSANEYWEYDIVTEASPVNLMNGGTRVATLKHLTIGIQPDPLVKLLFTAEAGGSDTPFTFTSALVPVTPSMTNPDGYASASITVTDGSGDSAATLTGQLGGGKSYEAYYNGSTVFSGSGLINQVVATAGSNSVTERSPLTGWTTISASVSNISSKYGFLLTAGDIATGSSTFQIVPEPSTLALIAIGCVSMLAYAWRRRNNRAN
jgi:hypothetical protein